MSSEIATSIQYNNPGLNNQELIDLYKALLLPRMIEEKMLSQLRLGKISKWFSGIGQEAISVGVTQALHQDEFILPMHRNLGVFVGRGIPLSRLFAQFQGKESGFTKGRDRSFHFGSIEHRVVGMISHLGPQLGIADGIALANKLGQTEKATFVFTGDGGASEGDFHEAVNVAAVWQLPVIIGIENNSWGLSTPSSEQFRCAQFVDKAIGYGIPEEDAILVDGNNILDVYTAVKKAAESIRKNPRPIIMEFKTFRIRGHEEASGTKYYPEGIIEQWEQLDPVVNFEQFLHEGGVIDADFIAAAKKEIKDEISTALKTAYAEDLITVSTEREVGDVFKDFTLDEVAPGSSTKEMRFIDAISDGLKTAMERHDKLVLMGQDIADYGGVFKVTEGFVDDFGKDRVRNTPLCESAILGAALGLSMSGYKAMMEMQFADFVTCGFNQIVNNLAKLNYRWDENADVVVRMPTGAGVGAGPFHSQSNEAWFFHTPGLKIAYPAFPADAKGLLLSAFEDPNPVMFFEHKALYRSISAEVPEGYYTIPFGKAARLRTGDSVSIITYGMGVHWALAVLDKHPEISADLIDLRTLSPLDTESIFESVNKTGKAIVLHEDCLTGGIGGEISALIHEHCWKALDAAVVRSASMDTPVPFAVPLENNFLASDRFEQQLLQLLDA
ncbi:MAG: dehydrogenase E1 component subunit alpha/beta [Flavobacteriales bacterium]|nr:dehydrogenase E1 component subunit alpha/beta [Flavobacteriales bacterium]